MNKLPLFVTVAALSISMNTFAGEFVRVDYALDQNRYELEGKYDFTPLTSFWANHRVVDEGEDLGLESTLSLAYIKHVKPLTSKLLASVDLGFMYETYGDTLYQTANFVTKSEEYEDNALTPFAITHFTYLFSSNFQADLDFTVMKSIKNQTMGDVYRSRLLFAYQPNDKMNILYRIGASYVNDDALKVIAQDNLVSDNYLIGHELYVGYKTSYDIEPYVQLKDMQNSGDRQLFAGFTYHFK